MKEQNEALQLKSDKRNEDICVLCAEVNELRLIIREMACEWERKTQESKKLPRQKDITNKMRKWKQAILPLEVNRLKTNGKLENRQCRP